jgi:hypothetical protein
VPFGSRGEANARERDMRARRGEKRQRAYLCRCGAWHLSAAPRTGRKKGGTPRNARQDGKGAWT